VIDTADETGVILSAVDNFSKQINEMAAKLDTLASKSQESGSKVMQLGDDSNFLKGQLMSLLPAFTAIAAVSFLKSAVEEAEKENEALRKLAFQVNVTGISYKENKTAIVAWGESIEKTTRFGKTEAYDSLAKLTKITGDLTTAQRLSKLAMDLAAVGTKSVQEYTQDLGLAYEGNTRGLVALRKEFGAQLEGMKDGTSILNKLVGTYGDAAEKEDSLTKSSAEAQHEWENLKKSIGTDLIPIVKDLLKIFKDLEPEMKIAADAIVPLFKAIDDVIVSMTNNMADEGKKFGGMLAEGIAGGNAKIVTDTKATGAIIAKDSQEQIKVREEDEKKMMELKKKIMSDGVKESKKTMDEELKNSQLTYDQDIEIVKNYYARGALDAEEYNVKVKDLENKKTALIIKNTESAMDFVKTAFDSTFSDLMKGTESFGSFFTKLFDNMVTEAENKLATLAANALFNALLSIVTGGVTTATTKSSGLLGLGGFLGFLDAGGEVQQTGLYKLQKGEKVYSDQPTSTIAKSGAIKSLDISSGSLKTKSAGGNVTLNNTFNISGDTKTAKQIAEEVGRELQRQVRGIGQSSMVTP
jgi:hypothetical protein